jgi:predicted CopG family antitoxin
MATKTVSIDEEAYRRLVRARRHAKESFSKVIHRAHWQEGVRRCGDVLDRARGTLSREQLEALERAQDEDTPPDNQWNR